MKPEQALRNLPPAQSPVYLVLLWPGSQGQGWQGRIKDAKTGAEQPFSGLDELLAWLKASENQDRRTA